MFRNGHKIATLQLALVGILLFQMFFGIPGAAQNRLMGETQFVEAKGMAPVGFGNDLFDPFVLQEDTTPPTVVSITRRDENPTSLPNVQFFVLFSESVIKETVNASDFRLRQPGLTGAKIEFVVGSGDFYTVGVETGTGIGTLRLDLIDNNTIRDLSNRRLGGPALGDGNFTAGEVYSVTRALAKPGIPILLSPATGTVANALQPGFTWKPSSPAAHHYQIQVAENNTFSPVLLDETDIMEATYTAPAELTPGKRYFWRVRAFNNLGTETKWSTVWNFLTPLAQPALVSPTEAEPLLTDRPTFIWDSVAGAAQYHLQVSAANNFSTLLVNINLNTNEFTLAKDLPQKKTIYWRVRARTPLVVGPWSPKWAFTTGNPPTVPVLIAPANGSLVLNYAPLFDWKNSTVPAVALFKHYQLQVDDSPDFSSTAIDNTTTESRFTALSDLDPNKQFYWRVRAVNTVGLDDHVSGWSRVWSFRTVIQAPQSLLMVPNPSLPRRPTLEWDDAIGPISGYKIQVSTSANFSTLLVNSATVNSTYPMQSNLPAGRTIYWRVRVNGMNGPSPWATHDFFMP